MLLSAPWWAAREWRRVKVSRAAGDAARVTRSRSSCAGPSPGRIGGTLARRAPRRGIEALRRRIVALVSFEGVGRGAGLLRCMGRGGAVLADEDGAHAHADDPAVFLGGV